MEKAKKFTTYLIVIISSILIFNLIHNTLTKKPPQSTNKIVLKDFRNLTNNTNIDFSQKPTVILFFTSWCTYCNEDAPKLVQLEKKYKDVINLYGINVTNRDDLQDLKHYVENYDIKYPILLDESGDIYKMLGALGFPSLFFFNKNGEVIDSIIGSTDIETIDDSFKYLLDYFNV